MVKHWMTKADIRKVRKLPKRKQHAIFKLEKAAIREKKEHPQLNRMGAMLIASQHLRKNHRY